MLNPKCDDISWRAERDGQDWRNEDVLSAVDWLASLIPRQEWERRAAQVHSFFQAAKAEWAEGRRVPLFDSADQIAWYMYMARCYGDPALRPDFFEPEGYRIAPVFGRIGQLVPEFREIVGAEERAARLLAEGRKQPDDGIYELLVAGAYKKRGWTSVEFVAEMPGIARRPDLFANRGRAHWAVECKRAGRSSYARDERGAGERMAARVHEMSQAAKRPLLVKAYFTAELVALPEDYLAGKAAQFLNGREVLHWNDEGGKGVVGDVDWTNLRKIFEHDAICFGSSRMAELLLGQYDPWLDFSIDGDWTPAEGRPWHATCIDHVSVVACTGTSMEAARRKAQHFRSVVGGASKQLPGDRPGVVHVGYEAVGGNSADGLRHDLNGEQMRTFDARDSKLHWVYGNYFMPERTTARMESAALSETTAWYAVAGTRVRQPLPGHLLFTDEDGRPGAHFRR